MKVLGEQQFLCTYVGGVLIRAVAIARRFLFNLFVSELLYVDLEFPFSPEYLSSPTGRYHNCASLAYRFVIG